MKLVYFQNHLAKLIRAYKIKFYNCFLYTFMCGYGLIRVEMKAFYFKEKIQFGGYSILHSIMNSKFKKNNGIDQILLQN